MIPRIGTQIPRPCPFILSFSSAILPLFQPEILEKNPVTRVIPSMWDEPHLGQTSSSPLVV